MRLFHKHKWKEVNRQFMGIKNSFDFPDGPCTLITYQCLSCSKYRQGKLMGHIPSNEEVTEGGYRS